MAGLQQQSTRERPDTFTQVSSLSYPKTLPDGAGHTFRRITSCSIALSSERSATIFFSLPFSSWSWSRRFISDRSQPAIESYINSTAPRITLSDTSQYSAVAAMFLWPINSWIVFIPTPFSFNLVANVRRPECDEVRIPDRENENNPMLETMRMTTIGRIRRKSNK